MKLLLISLCHSLNILRSLYHSLNILMIRTGMSLCHSLKILSSLCHSLKILMICPGISDTDLSCAAVNCVNWDFWGPTKPVPLSKAGRGLILHVLAGHELKLKSIQLVLLLEESLEMINFSCVRATVVCFIACIEDSVVT